MSKTRKSGVSKKKTAVAKKTTAKAVKKKAAVKVEEVEEVKEEPFNILQHFLVPKHEILSEEEKQQVLERYGVQPYQLPFISVNDPVVKELGAKPGDIIKITRSSETAGKAIYYRIVTKEVL